MDNSGWCDSSIPLHISHDGGLRRDSLTTSHLSFIFLHDCPQVLLTTPTTPTERMMEIAKASEGFLYLVSV
jgi:hypothetical protein